MDEVVEELLLEDRWQSVGRAAVKRRVGSLLSSGGGSGGGRRGGGGGGEGPAFESTGTWRSAQHKRITYRMAG